MHLLGYFLFQMFVTESSIRYNQNLNNDHGRLTIPFHESNHICSYKIVHSIFCKFQRFRHSSKNQQKKLVPLIAYTSMKNQNQSPLISSLYFIVPIALYKPLDFTTYHFWQTEYCLKIVFGNVIPKDIQLPTHKHLIKNVLIEIQTLFMNQKIWAPA